MDIDFIGDRNRRRFTLGYVFSIGFGAISQESKFHLVVALLRIKVEYIAVIHACKKAIWLKRLLGELKVKQDVVRVVKQDVVRVNYISQRATHLAKRLIFHFRTKHINLH